MVSIKSSDLTFSLIGKPKDGLPSLKLPTNLNVMLRFLLYFKCEKLSKQKSINRTCDEVVLRWKKVAEDSTTGYTIQSKLSKLWENYRTIQACGKRSSDEKNKTSDEYRQKLKSLFDIAKPDIEYKLSKMD